MRPLPSSELRTTRIRWGLALLVMLAAPVASSCQVHTAPITTSLRMQGTPPDARVTVDDEYLGALAFVARRGVALPPGRHRVTVEKAGYFPFDRLVTAEEGDPPIELRVTLEKVPD